MDDATLRALDASIEHWEKNVAALTPDQASIEATDCALCNEFNSGPDYSGCPGCPVKAATRWPICKGTPYSEAVNALHNWRLTEDAFFAKEIYAKAEAGWREAAQAELDFLKALRPIGLPPSEGSSP